MKSPIPEPWAYNSPDGLSIVDVRVAGDLSAHADAWADLLVQSTAASPMQSFPQISAFFETQILASETWLCLFAYEKEQLIGVLPLICAKSFGVPGFSVLCLKTPYDDLHTSGVDCLSLPGREQVLERFMDYLSRIPGTWPLIRMREIPENSSTIAYLNQGSGQLQIMKKPCGVENYIQLPADYANFHATLSSNFKRHLKRGNRKLEEQEMVRFRCCETDRSLEENVRRFEEVENAGWKGDTNTSVKAMEKNSRFFALAAERFRNRGWMEWNFLEAGDLTIAAQYGVRIKRTLFLLKIGYDEKHSNCSPGNLLLDKVIEQACIEGDLDEINCVADCAWHRNWGMKHRAVYDLVILPKIPIISHLLCTLFNSKRFQDRIQRLTSKSVPVNE